MNNLDFHYLFFKAFQNKMQKHCMSTKRTKRELIHDVIHKILLLMFTIKIRYLFNGNHTYPKIYQMIYMNVLYIIPLVAIKSPLICKNILNNVVNGHTSVDTFDAALNLHLFPYHLFKSVYLEFCSSKADLNLTINVFLHAK